MTLYFIALICFFAGFFIQKKAPKAERISNTTNHLVVTIVMPIVIISTIPDLKATFQSGFVILIPWLTFFAPLPLSLFIAKKYQLSKQELVVLIILCGLGNTAFLGIGLVRNIFGEAAVPSAILYDQLGSFLLVTTVVSILVAIYSDNSSSHTRPSARNISIKILSFPPFLSLLIGLFIPSTEVFGSLINHIFDLISLTIIPIALFIIGLHISLNIEKQLRIPLAYLLSMKLVVLPGFVLALSLLMNTPNPEFSTVILQAAMPPMVTPAIMLIQGNIAPKLVANALGIGTILSVLTLATWAALITKITF